MTRAFAGIVLLLVLTISPAQAERVVIGLAIPPGVRDGGMVVRS
jgi:hypothetical protein